LLDLHRGPLAGEGDPQALLRATERLEQRVARARELALAVAPRTSE
jgi:hypothetical protein